MSLLIGSVMITPSKLCGVPPIPKSVGFGKVLKTRPVHKTGRMMLHHLPSSGSLQLGILVPKKLSKRAVDRHTFKRLVREAVRVEPLTNTSGQLLVRLRAPIYGISYSDREQWWKEIRLLLSVLSSG